ncbi:hypothetical protein NW754_013036 [Fusarium falciforme]|uniref:DUF726 domain protein n=1 Tax=Fusarium falciforme TaxID=195108 RepID=A0A9W8R3A2_9HYPO|nr:hypothetical protein NW754_013036 [Fusarium falciforme]KAJ4184245.1 hypothetical protein NW755_009251 [Fusarium falciforme]KAJ4208088.1 hypothetical protein NW767_002313 [Fusarium falciforme]KAJ4259408.1 hypothetical protein NW757_002732 [Fusarium falciforme]
MTTQAVEVDDFGLPIRRYPTPKNDAAVEPITEEKDSSATNAVGGEQPKAPEEKADKTSNTAVPETTKPVENDDDDFKDARSQQPTPVEEPASKPSAPQEPPAPVVSKPVVQTKSPEPNTASTSDSKLKEPAEPQTEATEPSKKPANVEVSVGKDQPSHATESKSNPPSPTAARGRGTSNASHREGVSEFSHQHISTKVEEKENEDDGWQEMPSYARYDMYNDDNKLIAKEYDPEEDEKYGYAGLGGAGKGYTRVLVDDDAESATSMDDNTQYLFRPTNGTSMVDDDEGRDAISQMQATKDLLTEGQRVAYVGLVRLEIVKMVKEAETLETTRKTKKEVSLSSEAMMMWGQKMMLRLYAHMEINEAEQVMIEQLADHGVMPQDLSPALNTNARVANPMADSASGGTSTPGTPSLFSGDETPTEAPPPYEAPDVEELPDVKTPSQLPTTAKIDIDLRWTVLCDLFLILIADSVYDARSRVLLERVGQSLDISWLDICRFEKKVTEALEMQQAAEKENWNEDEHTEARRKRALTRRYVMMGLATVGGGLVIGLSAGLLAPVIGAGLATGLTAIGVTGTSGFLGGVGGAAIITSGAATTGSIIGGRAAGRRTGAVKTFEYRPLHNNKRVNLIVTVSGWLTGKVDDVRLPFSTVDPVMGDLYSVLFEPEMLRSMGDTINILATEALTQSIQQILGATILAALMSALQLPIILTKLSYLIDNPWAVSLDRATSAGKILADSLLERNLGTRPITLVGFSIGARVVFSCLQELSKKGAVGIVQNVYMFGSPIVVNKDEYIRAKTVVSGRFVNAFNRNDWILGYLFRLTSGGIRRVAGLAPIEDMPWIENMDVTDLVVGHMDYRQQMPTLLMRCGWSVESEEFVEIEDPDPDNHAERQRELINEIEEARRELEKEGKSKKSGRFSFFGRRKNADKQDWEIYDDTKGKGEAKGEASTKDEDANRGVLFDIDAIRAEIAKDARGGNSEEIQVKEIKSTLPPMKLDMASIPSSPAAANSSRDDLTATRDSREAGVSQERSRSYTPSYTRQASPPDYGAAYGGGFGSGHGNAYGSARDEDEIQMTFDTSFDDPPRSTTVPPKEETPNRPEIKSSHTLPTMTIRDPWNDPDDDDFGKEKEISMTFA